jgi:Domain of unknown function (DUF4430)
LKRLTHIAKNNLFIIFVFLFSLSVAIMLPMLSGKKVHVPFASVSPTTVPARTSFTYSGKAGTDALTLLQQQAGVKQNASGLVVSINHRTADEAKHEYWAFYVNGRLASVGPKEYQTKDTDRLLWRIEQY